MYRRINHQTYTGGRNEVQKTPRKTKDKVEEFRNKRSRQKIEKRSSDGYKVR